MIAKWVVAWKESFSSVKRDKWLRRKEGRRRGEEERKEEKKKRKKEEKKTCSLLEKTSFSSSLLLLFFSFPYSHKEMNAPQAKKDQKRPHSPQRRHRHPQGHRLHDVIQFGKGRAKKIVHKSNLLLQALLRSSPFM